MPKLKKVNSSGIYFTYLSEFESTWTGQTELEMSAFSIITVGAAIGNVLILAATWRHSRPLAAMNLFLCSQCASDLLLTSFNPFVMVVRQTRHWVLGDVICPLLNYAQSASAVTSILCMTSLAVDRYLQMSGRPRAAHSLQRHAVKVVAATWIVPLVWLSPFLWAWRVKELRQDSEQYTWCFLHWPPGMNSFAFIAVTGTVIFVAPLIVITFCYTRVLLNVRQSSRRVAPPTSTRRATTSTTAGNAPGFSRRRATERKLLKMLVVSVIAFAVLWLPFYCFSILLFFVHRLTSSQYTFVLLLGFTNACVNPVLIVGFNSHYQRHVAHLFPYRLRRCLWDKSRGSNLSTVTETALVDNCRSSEVRY